MSDTSSRITELEDVVIKLWSTSKGEQAKDPIKDDNRDHLIHVYLPEEITLQPKETLVVDLRQEFIFPVKSTGRLSLGLYAATTGVCTKYIFNLVFFIILHIFYRSF